MAFAHDICVALLQYLVSRPMTTEAFTGAQHTNDAFEDPRYSRVCHWSLLRVVTPSPKTAKPFRSNEKKTTTILLLPQRLSHPAYTAIILECLIVLAPEQHVCVCAAVQRCSSLFRERTRFARLLALWNKKNAACKLESNKMGTTWYLVCVKEQLQSIQLYTSREKIVLR